MKNARLFPPGVFFVYLSLRLNRSSGIIPAKLLRISLGEPVHQFVVEVIELRRDGGFDAFLVHFS